ncbi:hypothetical protein [Xanthomonas phaseoli]|uniref:hypothetical protein n=1 Tax=Xanthomonas phaseoli TaxID=1985254 RepID=UPI0003031A92|nr:hypothetical protein [Xanthomonas phaseoli]UEQ13668.1 hypothetical protein K9838_13110 [Xanthomonas phaseoli pv. manihotis]
MTAAPASARSTGRFRLGRGLRLQLTVVRDTVLAAVCPVMGDGAPEHYSLTRCDRDQVSSVPTHCMVFGNTAIPADDDTRMAITAWLREHDIAVREVP